MKLNKEKMRRLPSVFEWRKIMRGKMVDVLFDAPLTSTRDVNEGAKTLIFDNGSGVTITDDGEFWLEDKSEIQRAIAFKKTKKTVAL